MDYFINDKGIFEIKSTSYPDSVWEEYVVRFNDKDTEEQFEKFKEMLMKEGADRLSSKIRVLLGVNKR